MQQRPENPVSGASFPASKDDSDPAAHGLRVTPGWEALSGRSLCSGNGPCVPAAREGFHTPRERPGNFHKAFPSRLLCRSELASLGMSAPCSALVGRTPWAPTWKLGLGVLLAFFAWGALTRGGPATACKALLWLFASSCQSEFCSPLRHRACQGPARHL